MMEVYAGALSHADYNIGRLLDAVEQSGQLDNTLVIFMMGRQWRERGRNFAGYDK